MCVMSAGELCMPGGRHFLLDGSDSSLPTKFQSPSSSNGVKLTFAGLSNGCSETSSSLTRLSSSAVFSNAGSVPESVFKLEKRKKSDLLLDIYHKANVLSLGSYQCSETISGTLV